VVCALVVYRADSNTSSFDGSSGFLEYHWGARVFIPVLTTVVGGQMPLFISGF